MKRYKSASEYFENQTEFEAVLTKLRSVLNDCGLEETVKWGAPCYTLDGKMVVGVAGFKQWVALWFYQGALLEDPAGVLINAQEGRTQAMRQWRINSVAEIKPRLIKQYVNAAKRLVAEGKEIKPRRQKPLVVPQELESALAASKKAKTSFEALNLTRRREFADYIGDAKRDETKQKRLAKIMPMIEQGIGLNDKYR